MKLYFVRHGESKHGALGIHQKPESDLSVKGVQQAKFVANRFHNLEIDLILSSDYTRAQQTADEISRLINKTIIFTPLLREVKNPTSLEGKRLDDPDVITVFEMLHKNARLNDWHFSDEENFSDAKKRAIKFLEYATLLTENNVLAVTHGQILHLILSLMVFGKELTYEEFRKIRKTFSLSNTGVTMCEKDDSGIWKLITWNDHAHLG